MILVDTDLVTVSELEYLGNVSLLIDQNSARTVQNYIIWRFIMDQVKYMPKKFRAIRQTFNQVFEGITSEPSRKTACASYVNDNMGFAVSKLYINQYFDTHARNQVIYQILI